MDRVRNVMITCSGVESGAESNCLFLVSRSKEKRREALVELSQTKEKERGQERSGKKYDFNR